jgi:O-antigen/teichoic acid export membrane protein
MFSIWVIIISFWLILKDNIVKIVANEEYLEVTKLNMFTSSDAFTVILFMILFFYVWIIFSYLLIASDKQKRLLKISIILTIINIVWNIILIPYYSFIWAWIITVLTQITFLFLVYNESKKIIKFNIPYKFIWYVLVLWFFSYFILFFFINNYGVNLYLDLLYAIILFFIYIWIIFKIEKNRILIK